MAADNLADYMQRAETGSMTALELMAAASALEQQDRNGLMGLYQHWLASNGADPLAYAIRFNYAVLLGNAGLTAEACNAYILAIQANRQLFPAYINLASAYERLSRPDLALQIYQELQRLLSLVTAENIKYKILALTQLSRMQIAQGEMAAAETALTESLGLNRQQPEIMMHMVDLRLKQCKWPVFDLANSLPEKADFIDCLAPLTIAAYSNDPLLQLCISHTYSRKSIKPASASFLQDNPGALIRQQDKRLRIGYLTSDLYGHAIGSLMADIFGLHDRSQVEAIAYYYGPERNDHFQSRIRRDLDGWVDIAAMTDAEAAQRIAADGVDILVDVNGHSMNARTSIVAYQPAPIIVNWLGFPGTMGSAYHHYIIADDYIIPPDYERFYSERVERLPCYQPNDRQRIVAEALQSRQSQQLDDAAFVFCCFNGSQKITQLVFGLWMEILRQVPGSQLWLLSDQQPVNERLRSQAQQAGIDPTRLVFAERAANHEHLKRYQLADLFMDTFPYGAHTTASDALWMGVPVVTISGHGFASRVCGSLVRSAGLPELVCNSPEQYVAKAVEIALGAGGSQPLKARLAEQKESCVLFDMPLLVRSLEQSYRRIWSEYLEGRLPQPDLTNLAEYQEIGGALDGEIATFAPLEELLEVYRQRLQERRSSQDLRLSVTG